MVFLHSGSFCVRDPSAEIIRNLCGNGAPWIRLTATGKERRRGVKRGKRCNCHLIRRLPRTQTSVILPSLSRSPQTHVCPGDTKPPDQCEFPRATPGILEGNRHLSKAPCHHRPPVGEAPGAAPTPTPPQPS